MMPQWQSYPIATAIDPPYNWDYLSEIDPSVMYTSIENHRAVLSFAYMLPDPYV